jgi:hypothetical protein
MSTKESPQKKPPKRESTLTIFFQLSNHLAGHGFLVWFLYLKFIKHEPVTIWYYLIPGILVT